MGGFRKNIKYMLQQLFKFIVDKTRVADNTFQGIRVEPRMARDDYFSPAVRHSCVFSAFLRNPKSRFLESPDYPFGRNVREEHLCKCDFHFPYFRVLQVLFFHFKIYFDCVLNVHHCFFPRLALAVASRERRHMDVIPVIAFVNENEVFHDIYDSILMILGQSRPVGGRNQTPLQHGPLAQK